MDHPVQVPVRRDVPYPVDNPVPVHVDHPYEVAVPREVPVDCPVPIRHDVPYKVDVPYTVECNVPMAREVPVDMPVEVQRQFRREVPREVFVEKIVEVPYYVEKQVPIEVLVEVPVHREIKVDVPYYVENPVPVQVDKQCFTEVPVHNEVAVARGYSPSRGFSQPPLQLSHPGAQSSAYHNQAPLQSPRGGSDTPSITPRGTTPREGSWNESRMSELRSSRGNGMHRGSPGHLQRLHQAAASHSTGGPQFGNPYGGSYGFPASGQGQSPRRFAERKREKSQREQTPRGHGHLEQTPNYEEQHKEQPASLEARAPSEPPGPLAMEVVPSGALARQPSMPRQDSISRQPPQHKWVPKTSVPMTMKRQDRMDHQKFMNQGMDSDEAWSELLNQRAQ